MTNDELLVSILDRVNRGCKKAKKAMDDPTIWDSGRIKAILDLMRADITSMVAAGATPEKKPDEVSP